jgi:hypothetical protein
MSKLAELKAQKQIEQTIAAKLATGKFTNTGAKYSAEQAVADASNSNLRMTASVNANGQLTWNK